MDEAHRAAYLKERYSDDELIEELDRRLAEQGFEPQTAGVKIVVDYLREGWSVLALPPEMADQYDGVMGVGSSIHHLANELRRRLAGGPVLSQQDAKELLQLIEAGEPEEGTVPPLGPSPEETAARERLKAIAEGR